MKKIDNRLWILYLTENECVSFNLTSFDSMVFFTALKTNSNTGIIREEFTLAHDKFLLYYEYMQKELNAGDNRQIITFCKNEEPLFTIQGKYKARVSEIFSQTRDAIMLAKL